MSDELQNTQSHRRFATTSWSLVNQANADDSSVKNQALENLCRAYWYPLYAYLRRSGNDANRAADLTQAFFVELLEKQVLQSADHNRGRFRSFLMAALNHFVSNEYRKEKALKRGGDKTIFSLDFEDADQRFQHGIAAESSPDRLFLKQWALRILELAAEALGRQYAEAGKQQQFDLLRQYLSPGCEIPYGDVAQELNMQEGAIKVAVHRLRQRFGQELRLQIAQTVEDPAEVDDELNHLFEALGS